MKTKFSKGLFVGAMLLTTVSGHAWFGSGDDGGGYDQNQHEDADANSNVPKDVQQDFQEQMKDYVASIREMGKNLKVEVDESDPEIQYIRKVQREGLKKWEEETGISLADRQENPEQSNAFEGLGRIQLQVADAVRRSMSTLEIYDPYCKDPNAFKSLDRNSFETTARLTEIAQEPLFLDNKEAFSVEIRPFFYLYKPT